MRLLSGRHLWRYRFAGLQRFLRSASADFNRYLYYIGAYYCELYLRQCLVQITQVSSRVFRRTRRVQEAFGLTERKHCMRLARTGDSLSRSWESANQRNFTDTCKHYERPRKLEKMCVHYPLQKFSSK